MTKFDFKDLILFENEDYIVINKPPHVATINERTADKSVSILRMAKEYSFDAQVGHRLDKETSGALAIAKNPEAYRHLAMQFEHREVTKRYHAVANGLHDFDSISVFLPISPVKDGTAVKIDRQKGKAAETVFFTLKAFRRHTLVECIPITGRMHQIRIHLQCLKAPIVCDPTYGGANVLLSSLKKDYKLKQETEERPIMQRVALHAFSLSFQLMNGATIKVEAPYPKDFAVLVKLLEKNS
ncbi:RluA family pseudouridine synthase [Runella salmonicolor]|uniref:RluA family pseudouridine synthase n=1 Tax=Runella salmonicolor TaxID=2950278 RepID=A0ABT1FSG3_9BACT|nr:RluA family pseudouridine synthase [Runella salmonicolor]MCP1383713.1 RluA family pseudouridine synthase [Runella salmonicolor]